MRDRTFLDSNVALYTLDVTAAGKKKIAVGLVHTVPFISPQVLFECLRVCVRKMNFSKQDALAFVENLFDTCFFQAETERVCQLAFSLYGRYNFQPFDSKIVSAALVAGCSTLYSEDMQHGLVVENTLTIVNPFL